MKTDFSVSERYDIDVCLPSTVRSRLPFEPQGIGRRVENFGINRQFSIFKYERARRGDLTGTVVISVRSSAVVEEAVFVLVRVGMRAIGTHEGNG